jgi:uncharacterized protein (DUF433 family)
MDGRKRLVAGAMAGSIGLGVVLGGTVFSPGIGLADDAASAVVDACIGPVGAGALSAAAEAIGIRPVELLEERQGGNTIAEVAEEYEADVDAVIDAMVAAQRERLAQAVEAGWLTQDEADARAEGLEERIADLVNGDLAPFHGPIALPGGWGLGDGPIAAAAEAIGITPAALLEALRGGATLADVAEDQGVAVDAVIDAIVDAMRARLDRAVEDGWLTRERADALAERFEEHAADLVNGALLPFPRPGWHDRRLSRGPLLPPFPVEPSGHLNPRSR